MKTLDTKGFKAHLKFLSFILHATNLYTTSRSERLMYFSLKIALCPGKTQIIVNTGDNKRNENKMTQEFIKI